MAHGVVCTVSDVCGLETAPIKMAAKDIFVHLLYRLQCPNC